MNWQFNVYSLPILLVCSLLTNYLVIAWRWRNQTSTRWYIRFTLCVLLFSLLYVAELSTSNVNVMYVLDIASLLPGVLATSFLLLFCLSYTGYEHVITRRVQFALLIMPALYTIFIWTDGLHHQYLLSLERIEVNGLYFKHATVYFSPYLLVFFFYYVILQFSIFTVLFYSMMKSPLHLRKQYLYIILSLLPTLIATFVDATGTNPFPYLNIQRFALCLSIVPMGFALLRHRLLDIMPIAHDVIIKSMRDAVIIFDSRERIIEVNAVATAMIGKTPNQLLGLTLEEGFASLPGMVATLQHNYSNQATVIMTVQQDTRIFDLRVSPLHVHDGTLGGHIAVLRDITDTRRAEAQAEEIRLQQIEVKMLRSFIRDASHDLKTPITVIRSSAYLQQRYLERLTQQLESIEQYLNSVILLPTTPQAVFATVNALGDKRDNIDRNAERLQTMIDTMLQLVQLDQENVIHPTPNDLNAAIEAALAHLYAQAERKGVRLVYTPQPLGILVRFDPAYFPLVITHLVQNAITYTPAGGQIHISVSQDAQSTTIEVSDSGIGISTDDLPHIFERFYRADKARSIEEGGMGLGLAIARKIVEAHSGTLQVVSSVAQGSTFRVCLPLHPTNLGVN